MKKFSTISFLLIVMLILSLIALWAVSRTVVDLIEWALMPLTEDTLYFLTGVFVTLWIMALIKLSKYILKNGFC